MTPHPSPAPVLTHSPGSLPGSFSAPAMSAADVFSAPVVEISGVTFSYGRDNILDNVSLTVAPEEFLALIGPNGGGKTTLLRLILGLLQPDAGSVRVFGAEPGAMNNRIGYVPQFCTMQAGFPASVLDMVLMGAARPSPRGGSWTTGKAAREKALQYLDTLGLADAARHPVCALSGGQRQRVLVARALMSRPQPENGGPSPFLLLLDEPTASIDPEGTFCFYEFMDKLRGSVSLLVVSHDLLMVSPFFSSIAVVNKSLTRLRDGELTPDNLTTLFGRHLHECPVADLQHAGRALHDSGCTHHACADAGAGGRTRRAEAGTDAKADDACACAGPGREPSPAAASPDREIPPPSTASPDRD